LAKSLTVTAGDQVQMLGTHTHTHTHNDPVIGVILNPMTPQLIGAQIACS